LALGDARVFPWLLTALLQSAPDRSEATTKGGDGRAGVWVWGLAVASMVALGGGLEDLGEKYRPGRQPRRFFASVDEPSGPGARGGLARCSVAWPWL